MRWMLRVTRRSRYSDSRRRCSAMFDHADPAGLITIAWAFAMVHLRRARGVPAVPGGAQWLCIRNCGPNGSASAAAHGRKAGEGVNMTAPEITGQVPDLQFVRERGFRRRVDHASRQLREAPPS